MTAAGKTMRLEEPFIVFATQNPIEHEGTYPLPEAQLDRFLFHLMIDYPSPAEEKEIVLRTTAQETPGVQPVLTREEVLALQGTIRDVPVPDHVLDYILRLVTATRPQSPAADETFRRYVAWGAGPRASQNLTLAAKALALLRGRPAASVEEVREAARPVLRHRVIPNYNATGEGISVEFLLDHLLKTVPTA